MAQLTLGQCYSSATAFTGRNDWAVSEASLYANFALEQVAYAAGVHHRSRESLYESSTTSGGYRVALPAQFDGPIAVTLYRGSNSTNSLSRTTVSVPLIQKDSAFIDAQQGQGLGGIPEYYVWFSSWVELFPSPDSSYSLTLRMRWKQPSLITSTATPALDEKWHQPWLYKTVELLEGSRANAAGEAVARNRYLNSVSLLETDLALSQLDRRSMSLRRGFGRDAKHD